MLVKSMAMGRNSQTEFVFLLNIETCRIPSKKPDAFSELIEVGKFWPNFQPKFEHWEDRPRGSTYCRKEIGPTFWKMSR